MVLTFRFALLAVLDHLAMLTMLLGAFGAFACKLAVLALALAFLAVFKHLAMLAVLFGAFSAFAANLAVGAFAVRAFAVFAATILELEAFALVFFFAFAHRAFAIDFEMGWHIASFRVIAVMVMFAMLVMGVIVMFVLFAAMSTCCRKEGANNEN